MRRSVWFAVVVDGMGEGWRLVEEEGGRVEVEVERWRRLVRRE